MSARTHYDPGPYWNWARYVDLLGAPLPDPGVSAAQALTIAPVAGQSFVVAGSSGEWTAIWFGGRLAWFDDPPGRVIEPAHGALVTPRPGRSAIPVYGAAYPEAAAYPPTIPVVALVVGNRRLAEISFNHRRAFVDAADVLVLR